MTAEWRKTIRLWKSKSLHCLTHFSLIMLIRNTRLVQICMKAGLLLLVLTGPPSLASPWPSFFLTDNPLPWQQDACVRWTSSAMPHWLQPRGGGREEEGQGQVRGSLTATACPSSAGAKDWASDFQGVEVPWPLSLAQKNTQIYVKI